MPAGATLPHTSRKHLAPHWSTMRNVHISFMEMFAFDIAPMHNYAETYGLLYICMLID
jgi:hypothetical protein